jgi:hypothetical protein
MAANYRAVMLMKPGGPEALEVVELRLNLPVPGNCACGSAPRAWARRT